MWPGEGRVCEVEQVCDFAQGRGWPCVHGQRSWEGPSRANVSERAGGSGRCGWRTYRKSLRDTMHRTTNGASCIVSVCLPAYIVLGLAGHAAAPRVARQAAAALVRRPARRPITCRSWQATPACELRHGRGAWVGRLGYLTVGQHAVEWRAARGVSASGSTYAPTTRHRMWARELDVTHADVAHASGGRTSETRIVPNVYRGAGSPCSAHARTYPL